MTAKRERKSIARELPPVGTTMVATYKGQAQTAEIVEAKKLPAGKAVKYGDKVFSSLSAAGRAVTGHGVNGWVFWHPAETSGE
jgi:predicted RecA/RadA family phage recombinase